MMKWVRRIALGALLFCAAVLIVGAVWERTAEARDARRFPPPGRMVDIGDGVRLHLRCEGPDKGGPTAVMVAGGGTPSVVSYGLQDRIAGFARVCSYDRPGLGWSDPAKHPMTLDDQVAGLDRLLSRGGIVGPVVLVPESFGAIISIAYAEQHPGRVAGIVFVDGAEPKTWAEAMQGVSKTEGRLREALMQAAWATGAARLAFPSMTPPFFATLPPEVQGEIRAIYSRASPGFSEAVTAFERTPASGWPSTEPGVWVPCPSSSSATGTRPAWFRRALRSSGPKARRASRRFQPNRRFA